MTEITSLQKSCSSDLEGEDCRQSLTTNGWIDHRSARGGILQLKALYRSLQYFCSVAIFQCINSAAFVIFTKWQSSLMNWLWNQVKIQQLPTFSSRVVSLACDESFMYCGLASGQIKSVLSPFVSSSTEFAPGFFVWSRGERFRPWECPGVARAWTWCF